MTEASHERPSVAPESAPALPTVAVIGPLPPPTHGHMVFTQSLLGSDRLNDEFRIVHVDISDHRGFENIGRLDLGNVAHAARHMWRLLSVLLRDRPGITYVPLAQNVLGLGRDLAFIAMSLLMRTSVVAHVHGGGFTQFLARAPAWFRGPARALLRRCRVLVVMNESQRPEVAAAVKGPRVVVLPHGTESADVDRSTPEGPLRALFVSSALHTDKGLETLLVAAARAQRAGVTRHWDIIGPWLNEDERRAIEPLVDGVERIEFHGALSREQVAESYATADVFVFPTHAVEGFGLVRIEAMAAGLPVITTEAGGAREIVRDGIDGFIVDYDSPDEIVSRLEELAAEPDRLVEMGRSARERQRADFGTEAFEDALAGVWRQVADAGHS